MRQISHKNTSPNHHWIFFSVRHFSNHIWSVPFFVFFSNINSFIITHYSLTFIQEYMSYFVLFPIYKLLPFMLHVTPTTSYSFCFDTDHHLLLKTLLLNQRYMTYLCLAPTYHSCFHCIYPSYSSSSDGWWRKMEIPCIGAVLRARKRTRVAVVEFHVSLYPYLSVT